MSAEQVGHAAAIENAMDHCQYALSSIENTAQMLSDAMNGREAFVCEGLGLLAELGSVHLEKARKALHLMRKAV